MTTKTRKILQKPIIKRGRFETQVSVENIEPSQVVEEVAKPVKAKRGRKPGSKNKPKDTTTTTTTADRPVPRRGRPPKAERGKALAEED